MQDQTQTKHSNPTWLVAAIVMLILALPVAVWRDVTDLTDQNLRRQSENLSTVLGKVRSYYAANVVSRVNGSDAPSQALHNYHDIPGAVPIPATMSIELGEALDDADEVAEYRFVSDYAFTNRPQHELTDNERLALERFRAGETEAQIYLRADDVPWHHSITLLRPVVLSENCVGCHNSHPESPRKDWKAGDVRGIEAITVHQPLILNLRSFKWLLGYLIVAGGFALWFSVHQFRMAGRFAALNLELEENNSFLAGVSMKISKYLSPQVYRSIFSGEKDVEISTERKKLTVFFSDIKDFTETTEMLQPEELTALLNEYFTEMAAIAERHGATIDKFIGDAIVAFFGDPETRGTTEDARACVAMALDMQNRLAELDQVWRDRGLERPFQARMGINTGYCNVGNFGSEERMDYTIIGAEANLAARLESIAPPGGIVMSYETYAHVRDMVEVEELPPTEVKGIAREVIPYRVVAREAAPSRSLAETSPDGKRLTVHLDRLNDEEADLLRQFLGVRPPRDG